MSRKQKNKTKPPQQTADDGPLFFFMPNEKWGEFFQWHKAVFTVSKEEISSLVGHTIDNDDPHSSITFTCAEKFMMYYKAARFHDTPRQVRVLETQSPKEQKALGRGTIGFMHESWDMIKSAVVEAGNVAKFGQNPRLARILLSTGDRELCEAASKERVWGIGYTAKHAMAHQDDWGENLLGKALMAARERLRAEEGGAQ